MAGWAYVYTMPDVYGASARVFVDTESLIRPLMQGLTAQQNTMSEVQLVSTAVLTRPNLERVARTTDLYLRAETERGLEDLVTGLQRRIAVRGGRDNIFTIEYEDRNRAKAREVVAAILDTFVENAIGAQGDDTEVSERALVGEMKDHEDRLLQAEAALAEFKRENLGYMPGETGDYYSRLQAALAAVAQTEERVRSLTQRRNELLRQVEGEEPVIGLMSSFDVGAGGGSCSDLGQISQLEAQLSLLRVDFTDKHPRIVTIQDQIATLEGRCAEQNAANMAAGISTAGPVTTPLEGNPVYQNMRIQLSNTDVELVELRAELNSHQNTVETLRRDVDKIGEVETALKQLNRDYNVVQDRHQQLLRRWEDLQASKRLDPVTDSVQYRTIEPPFAPADPVGPNRLILILGVFACALGAGGAVAFALNQLQPVFYTRRSIEQYIGLPVLGTVSMLLSPREVVKHRAGALVWLASYVLLIVATVAVIALSGRASQIVASLVGGFGA
jgi:polysaccharide chain length determinant protein (PEP-CTERM system associated)